MIDRYSLPKMKKLWENENKYEAFLKVEEAACLALVRKGIIPLEDYEKIKAKAKVNASRIDELEAQTKHDVIAFTRSISECLGDEKKWVHYGLTSTDVVDSANALILRDANNILEEDINALLSCLKEKAIKYKDTPIMGRTHGMHAEVTSFGLKFALFYDEVLRNLKRFKEAREDVETCKISGAVGNYVTLSIDIEKEIASILELNRASISTQVLSRDRHAFYISVIALIASSLEKMATEIRNLARQEVHEVEEYFASGQKGSSAMPHKRNPIGCENICGCARVLKSYVNVALDNNVLWHERDISHSSAERIILADSTILLDYMLNRFTKILKNLTVFEDKMLVNINLTRGLVFSGAVLNKMVEEGSSREEAYDKVQALAFEAMNSKEDFIKLVKRDHLLDDKKIDSIFDLKNYLKNTDAILKGLGILEK